jgi:hypothetical protein
LLLFLFGVLFTCLTEAIASSLPFIGIGAAAELFLEDEMITKLTIVSMLTSQLSIEVLLLSGGTSASSSPLIPLVPDSTFAFTAIVTVTALHLM